MSYDKMMCHVAAQKSTNSLRYKYVNVGTTGNPIVLEWMSNIISFVQ
jgi:hypothetical protein